ncbi:MAG: 50S ribosomal protein L6 [Candidatus Eremiobacteraeota bacterium]|nr:50S ribosomal protein L6 [Candidatus Eremiobacteraeota bacterium]
MSRIGKMPVQIPEGVNLNVSSEGKITVKGPKGQLSYNIPERFKVDISDGQLKVTRPGDSRKDKATHGLVRTLIRNMVVGVTDGYSKKLEVVGVGYKTALLGEKIQLNVGYSHPVVVEPRPGITFELPSVNTIVVKGIDKYLVGQVAADIRDIRRPEPYKGKGIRYSDEVIQRKVGKAGA